MAKSIPPSPAKPVTTTIKPNAPNLNIREQWVKLEEQRTKLRRHILGDLFGQFSSQTQLLKEIDRQFENAAGSREIANREKLGLAVKNTGSDGLPLANAQFFIHDVKELTDARNYLKRTKDDDGNDIAPVIREVRGDNNELRLYYITPEAEKPEVPAEADDNGEAEA